MKISCFRFANLQKIENKKNKCGQKPIIFSHLNFLNQAKRSYFVVAPFTERRFTYNFTIDLPEFHAAKDSIQKHSYEAAIANLNRGKDIITHSMGEKHDSVIDTKEMLSRLYFEVEQYDQALKLSNELLQLTENNKGALDKRIKAYEHAVECCKMLGKNDDAIGLAGAASILCREHEKWRENSAFLLEIGSLFLVDGKLEEALKNINLAAKVMEEHGIKTTHLRGALNNNWGCYYKAQGKNEMADEYFLKALKIATAARDEGLEADVLSNHGETLIALGKFQEAQNTLEKAIELHKKRYSKGHEKIVADMLQLATVCSHQNKDVYVESLLHRAEDLCEVALDRTDMNIIIKQKYRALLEQSLMKNAALLAKEGRMRESNEYTERAAKVAGGL